MARRPYEPTLPRNPQQLTIDQHIHSKSCIKRFADNTNRVGVLQRGGRRVVLDGPASARFCAKRVWDQRLEHGGLFRRVEGAFLAEAEAIITKGTVTNHDAVTEYISLWQLRANLDAKPPASVEINGVANTLTKQQEEILESKHVLFMRGSTVPSRFVASMEMLPRHERNMAQLRGVRWGVLTAEEASRFVCADHPACELSMALTPTIALVARVNDQGVGNISVDDFNRQAYANCRAFVFGHPNDVEAFRQWLAIPTTAAVPAD